jgi:hypothetical protein
VRAYDRVYLCTSTVVPSRQSKCARIARSCRKKPQVIVPVGFSAKTQAVGLERAPNGETYVEA